MQTTPRSFGLLLRALRLQAGLELEHLAKILNETPGRFRPAKSGNRPLSSTYLTKREHGEADAYWLLERYGEWAGYTTGLLYLLSRISTHLRNREVDDLKALTRYLRQLANRLDKEVNELIGLEAPDFSGRALLSGNARLVRESMWDFRRWDPDTPGRAYKNSPTQKADARQLMIILAMLDRLGRPAWPIREPNWFVLTGAPSAGKSATLRALRKRGFKTVEETAARYIDEKLDSGTSLAELRLVPGGEQMFQRMVLYLKQAVEQNVAVEIATDKPVFFDRGMPDSIAYYAACGLDDRQLMPLLATQSRYKKVFLLERLPYRRNERRIETEEQCAFLHAQLERAYRKLEYDVVVVPIMGDRTDGPDRRAKFILKQCGLRSRAR